MGDWASVLGPVAGWYIAVQLCAVASLPLCFRLFKALPDRGYSAAKILGILLVGYLLWLGTALGLLRNDAGGTWLALLAVAGMSWAYGARALRSAMVMRTAWPRAHVVFVEALFLSGLVTWAYVRAHDPAANHTEQPMDLMFLNSIWYSPTYPPQDAWFAGYAIAYYYFGYWLLATVARLANTPPEIAYNAGQAAWFGLLLVGVYGASYNLLAFGRAGETWTSRLGGLFAVCGVALAGNLQTILEWLYANGAPIQGLARWLGVHNFPDNASVTGAWFISTGSWWWWRSSRVIHDRNLSGGHIEVIDEFPMFSYVLGDNHPHVLAMPVVVLAILVAMNVLFHAYVTRRRHEEPRQIQAAEDAPEDHAGEATARRESGLGWFPGGRAGFGVSSLVVGSLLFLNTWDFPPYWGLLLLACLAATAVSRPWTGEGELWSFLLRRRLWVGGVLILATLAINVPYLLTAQSQAGGLVPNFFNPTRIQQFMVMFGGWVPVLSVLIWQTWRLTHPRPRVWAGAVSLGLGVPVVFLLITAGTALFSGAGQTQLAGMTLPADAPGYGAIMLQRWVQQGYTFLVIGVAVSAVLAILWQWFASADASRRMLEGQSSDGDWGRHARMGFALLLLLCGLILVYLPEFVFLRDQFGTRMNTIFKFYYQAWLLFGLAGAYAVTEQFRSMEWKRRHTTGIAAGVPAGATLVLVLACLIFPFAATYSKTGGFSASQRTLDSTAYLRAFAPESAAAIDWLREHVPADAIVLEAEGRSYSAEHNRVSTMTGRATLLGWSGHQRQWRGEAYSAMAAGRSEAIEAVYRSRSPAELTQLLSAWSIDFVYVSPVERREYQMSEANEAALAAVSRVVFELGDVRVFRFDRTGARIEP